MNTSRCRCYCRHHVVVIVIVVIVVVIIVVEAELLTGERLPLILKCFIWTKFGEEEEKK